ncbi:VCBS repeat-containing protein [candidate division KSB1 bacterium]|nr:VCBS repeat-containing protein [candidate division KSB1 bacterium]
MKTKLFIIFLFFVLFLAAGCVEKKQKVQWKHLSSANGEIEVPNSGSQQTATAVFDIDKDGDNDFIITERTKAPAVVWYQRNDDGWKRFVLDKDALRIEAGSAIEDIDGDGDQDVVFAGDSGSNMVWWWENPYPDHDPAKPWNRYEIKNSGKTKHHDQLFGDFDGDSRPELIFWNQNDLTLFLAEIPAEPKTAGEWEKTAIYTYEDTAEPPQRGAYPQWKGVNEHEGLTKMDIDGDGKPDIIGGGLWFKHISGNTFIAHVIDDTYAFSRSAAGQLVHGGPPEVILVVGDGRAPLVMYELRENQWKDKILIDAIQDGHSLDLIDFNGDDNLDIFIAEMQLGEFKNAKIRILLGDGAGNFTTTLVDSGFGLHESRIADLDGDGDYDILGKPYNWKTPRLDIWLNTTK